MPQHFAYFALIVFFCKVSKCSWRWRNWTVHYQAVKVNAAQTFLAHFLCNNLFLWLLHNHFSDICMCLKPRHGQAYKWGGTYIFMILSNIFFAVVAQTKTYRGLSSWCLRWHLFLEIVAPQSLGFRLFLKCLTTMLWTCCKCPLSHSWMKCFVGCI